MNERSRSGSDGAARRSAAPSSAGTDEPGVGPAPGATAPKDVWRSWARARRAALDVGAVSAAVRAALVPWLAAREPTTIVVYLATAHEVGVARLAQEPALAAHRFATTRTPDHGPLTVHPLDARRERHRFGFEQPVADAALVAHDDVGIVLVPGLAFSADGRRLGHGGGYYDRLLAALAHATAVGVAAEALVVPDVPTEAHDVAVGWLVTEAGVRRCAHAPIASQPE
ncbi:MAG: 5-formyltetrahydrofolate cyclo-ligase [Actinomycetota bacterium]|nr:5-formyltetrahydrofolate cyclo-ligase [Actinomycetota bacterium]